MNIPPSISVPWHNHKKYVIMIPRFLAELLHIMNPVADIKLPPPKIVMNDVESKTDPGWQNRQTNNMGRGSITEVDIAHLWNGFVVL